VIAERRQPDVFEYWESKSRSQILRQPHIRDNIIEAMRANPSKSFDQIAEDIGHWCSASTIHKWIQSHHGYTTYAQRSLPLLTEQQKRKHVNFGKHLRNNWGLPRQKIMWINYDEKWFFGWASRCNAKMCELLGLERTHFYIYHKCHIEKVMAVAFTACAFDQNVENGGHGIKLGLYRVQAAPIAKKTVRERVLETRTARFALTDVSFATKTTPTLWIATWSDPMKGHPTNRSSRSWPSSAIRSFRKSLN
jgi:hypothetical protein